jgi:hypothetical protein
MNWLISNLDQTNYETTNRLQSFASIFYWISKVHDVVNFCNIYCIYIHWLATSAVTHLRSNWTSCIKKEIKWSKTCSQLIVMRWETWHSTPNLVHQRFPSWPSNSALRLCSSWKKTINKTHIKATKWLLHVSVTSTKNFIISHKCCTMTAPFKEN